MNTEIAVRPSASPYVVMPANYKPTMRTNDTSNGLVIAPDIYKLNGAITNGNIHLEN